MGLVRIYQTFLDDWEYPFIRRIWSRFLFSTFLEMAAYISDRGFPWKNTLIDFLTHTLTASLLADSIVIFSCSGEYGFNKFFRRFVTNRFSDRMEGGSIVKKDFSNGKNDLPYFSEPVNTQHHESLNVALIFRQIREFQEFLTVVETQVFCSITFSPKRGQQHRCSAVCNIDDINPPEIRGTGHSPVRRLWPQIIPFIVLKNVRMIAYHFSLIYQWFFRC